QLRSSILMSVVLSGRRVRKPLTGLGGILMPRSSRTQRAAIGIHTGITLAITRPGGVIFLDAAEPLSNCGNGERVMNVHIGDCVTFRDRAYVVRGMSPMGAVRRRLQLEEMDTGEHIEVSGDSVHRVEDGSPIVPGLTRLS